MTQRLGETLIDCGKLNHAKLEEALREQAIFGGKFGTNLIQMGYLEEDELARLLSEKTGIPCATSKQLMEVAPEVVALIPEEVAKKYRAVPLALEQRRLTLAMVDPTDFAAIEELSFITGYLIKPLVTPELRLICALEKHYHIPREARYIRVDSQGRKRTPAAAPAQHEAPLELEITADPDEEECLELPPLEEAESFSDPEGMEFYLAGASVSEEVPPRKTVELSEVLQGFAVPRDRKSVAELIVEYTGQLFDNVALFLLKGEQAFGWMSRHRGRPVQGFERVEIPLGAHSVLQRVAQTKESYLGSLTEGPLDRVAHAWGGRALRHSLLIPLLVMDKVVGFLCIESADRQRLSDKEQEFKKLIIKSSYAFEILILRSKILAS